MVNKTTQTHLNFLSKKIIILTILLFVIDACVRLLPHAEPQNVTLPDYDFSYQLSEEIKYSNIHAWLKSQQKDIQIVTDEPQITLDNSVDEALQEGAVDALWADDHQYILKGVFGNLGHKVAVLQVIGPSKQDSIVEVVLDDELRGYQIKDITLNSLVILSPNQKTITLRLFEPSQTKVSS